MDPRYDRRDDAGFWFEVALEREAIHEQFGSVPLPRPRPANYLERGEAT